ncbi:glycoside hydrolase family 12 protein [Laccaria bicolor S238N-H82]|uniref:Glycoside hydrolase family 12 protein n=1 Tax=Laccaria bicolor (strain S238N-H82 / ATCC MYA-4686) TaxID=486041 RepID=B0D6F8_LACBS|nr:glycoside hydrolase family 12 protein [Laccaria bicolor S238N-H82]EDR10183.1 glycoside hydrolase family 12 protein [Laccaria bicolor S238N-H82]|eukprot:XP_001879568.1 glycoside hydrolase family 12 protein [Laccaria bicolor S238N-H82]
MHSFKTTLLSAFLLLCSSTHVHAGALDTSSHCGDYDSVTAGQYVLGLDQWGKSDASSGSSCAAITSFDGTTIAWKNPWKWAGGYNVKSYTNIQLNNGLNKPLQTISSIPTTWKWSQSTSGSVVADVAFDLFTSATPGGSNHNEIMIWLANFSSGPISYSYSASGNAVAFANSIPLAGYTWNLYVGTNGYNNVYSFLPSNGTIITKFGGDLNVFIKYLTGSGSISSSEYLTTLQAGTEATSGTATFRTSAYSVVIN